MDKIHQRIATELRVESAGDGGRGAPRRRRDGAVHRALSEGEDRRLDDTQLRKLEERLGYLRELEDRRATVLKTIDEQGKLTPELVRSIDGAQTRSSWKTSTHPSNRAQTKAQIAREAGLEPLATRCSATRRSCRRPRPRDSSMRERV